jgi:sensor histidine kinase YesM
MRIKLPRYTSRDYLILGIVILPITLIINSVILGSHYYSGWKAFLSTTALTALAFTIHFTLCGAVAVLLKKRLPKESQVSVRLTLMIITFILLTGLFLYVLFRGYESLPFLDYSFNEPGFIWAYMGMAIVNVFLTLLFEGIARYESWKNNLKETEALKKVYRQGRLIGLKSQVNPHFLFNSLNSLSCLIQEDQQKGERFLDEMSKVYRYMLHNDEETLVPLATELNFLHSYVHLLTARHNEGLKITVEVTGEAAEKWLPPLTLQTIIENIVAQNSICKECPLEIAVFTDDDNSIAIRHNLTPKLFTEYQEPVTDPGLDNLIKKYRLLNQRDVSIEQRDNLRVIRLPLIENKEEVVV